MIKVSKLKLRDRNPRKITDEKMLLLEASISRDPEFMLYRPIVVDDNSIVLGGNMRLRAIRNLGMTEIPNDWVVKVKDLPPEKQRRFILVDNMSYGEWDADIMKMDWTPEELSDIGFDPGILDFEAEPEPEPETDYNTDPDEVPEAPVVPVSKRGDVWLCGRHRVMCGDSTSADDVGRLMGGVGAALCHADPPYGMGKEKDGVQNDNLYAEKLDAFQMAWWRAFRAHMDDNAGAYVWGNAKDLWRLWYVGGLKDSERLTFRGQIIWNKPPSASAWGSPIGSEKMRSYPHGYEVVLFFMLGEQGFNNNADNYWEGWDSVVNYLSAEKKKTGWDIAKFKRLAGHSETSGCHWFDKSQWMFPTKAVYESWQKAAKGDAFKRQHDELKRQHDELKRQHDELKQEFYATRAYFDNTHDNMTDVWEFPRVTGAERHGHATPKPVAMIERIMRSSLPDGGLCVEPFLGSGTTLIAAEKTKRTCYGMEISESYTDVVCCRFYDFTGIQPVNEKTGEKFPTTQKE